MSEVPLAAVRYDRIVAIGASTGGVEALVQVLGAFPENCPPTVIVQHMPGPFTTSFTRRLNEGCAPRVMEAEEGAPLESGTVYLAPGSEKHLGVTGTLTKTCTLTAADPVKGHRPSVDFLFRSLVGMAHRTVACILTGMGSDGAEGMKALRDGGAVTFAQDVATSVVFGMPRAAIACGAADRGTPIHAIARSLLDSAAATAGAA